MEDALIEYQAGDPVDAEELSVVRDLARKAYADAIPELIDGGSVAEIMGSVEDARAAYARVLAEVKTQQASQHSRPPIVPAGGSAQAIVDVDRLPASEKLRIGVEAARRR
jgi:hypothetical protein